MEYSLKTPIDRQTAKMLKAGDIVKLSGYIYTARDAAHKRMVEEFEKTGKFPIDINNVTIYYAGPAPAKPGRPIGSCGPTTSYRMDAYAPLLIDNGETGMIGKGLRNQDVIDAMKRNGAVYFGATGGAGALIANHIKSAEVVCYEDLGAEAVRKLYVEDFPVVVIIDSLGNNLYETEKLKYREI